MVACLQFRLRVCKFGCVFAISVATVEPHSVINSCRFTNWACSGATHTGRHSVTFAQCKRLILVFLGHEVLVITFDYTGIPTFEYEVRCSPSMSFAKVMDMCYFDNTSSPTSSNR